MKNGSISAEAGWECSHPELQFGVTEMSGNLGPHGKIFLPRKGNRKHIVWRPSSCSCVNLFQFGRSDREYDPVCK